MPSPDTDEKDPSRQQFLSPPGNSPCRRLHLIRTHSSRFSSCVFVVLRVTSWITLLMFQDKSIP